MTPKSYFVKFTDNKCPNSCESGSGKVCAVKKTSTGEWLNEFVEQDLDSENVLYVCSSNCKKCDFNPTEKSCNGDGPMVMTIVYGAKFTVEVSDGSKSDID
jgi:hypothetical protein